VGFIPKRPGETDIIHADLGKIPCFMQWEPKITIEEGARNLLGTSKISRLRRCGLPKKSRRLQKLGLSIGTRRNGGFSFGPLKKRSRYEKPSFDSYNGSKQRYRRGLGERLREAGRFLSPLRAE
jgi:hypothetical protein